MASNIPPLAIVQQELHIHQYLYANAENLTKFGKLCYPLHRSHIAHLSRLHGALLALPHTHTLRPLASKFPPHAVLRDEAYASALATLHRTFYATRRFATVPHTVRFSTTFASWKRRAKFRDDLDAVHVFCRYACTELKPFAEEVLLTGSVSTLDYASWSDCDVIIVVKDAVLSDAAKLQRFQRALARAYVSLLQHDPLQHHGCMLTSPRELAQYPEGFLPLAVWKRAVPLFGSRMQTFGIRTDHMEAAAHANALFTTVRTSARKRWQSTYDLKNFYHLVSLLPCVMLNRNGLYRDKAGCFRTLFHTLPEDRVAVLRMVTNIRQTWHTARLPRFLERAFAALPSYHLLRLANRLRNGVRECRISEHDLARLEGSEK